MALVPHSIHVYDEQDGSDRYVVGIVTRMSGGRVVFSHPWLATTPDAPIPSRRGILNVVGLDSLEVLQLIQLDDRITFSKRK